MFILHIIRFNAVVSKLGTMRVFWGWVTSLSEVIDFLQKKVIVLDLYNRKICSKMITSIIRYHTAIYYIMSITRNRFRPYWVSSGGCKKHSIINMLKKQICHWVQKNAIQNNMIQQYLYHGGHIQGHTHMTWTTSHIGKP